ncbi:MAG TPA: hypothetical protein VMU83_22480, partial [Hanamia sp.]|nr:hypothetical protein [Hanamia sp.]
SVIAIAVAFYQAVVTTELSGFRMFAYGAFEIQDSKVVNPLQIRTPLVHYKSNKGLIRVVDFLYLYPPTGKLKIWR